MAILEWDKAGEKHYQMGIDHGVLYLPDGTVAPWNGLRGLEESYAQDSQAFYLDGVKYLQRITPGDFSAKLRAFTYPDEFDRVVGNDPVAQGMIYHGQSPKKFHLSYRTLVGNDLDGTNAGYKLHILYNLMAQPDPIGFSTLGDQLTPIEFAWTLMGTPVQAVGHGPVVHISIDSRDTDPTVLETIETILYGSSISNPRLPAIDEVTDLFELYGALVIVDHGDGTWSAIDIADQYITMDSPTEFTISNVNATYSDTETYQVSTTNP